MFKSNEIPDNFNKIADFGDNFVVFVKENTLTNGQDYEAYVQYFKPHFYVLHLTDYRITKGDSYSFDYNYVPNGIGGSYIDSADYNFSLNTYTSDTEFSGDTKLVADYNETFQSGVLIMIIFLWVFKGISRLFFKGGLY